MNTFKIVPITREYAANIRNSRKDDFGHDVYEQVASGPGPCRVSLKPFLPGKDNRLLLSYSPFEIDNAFNQPGPIFINIEDVEAYENIYQFPQQIKADKINFPITLIGYDKHQMMVFTKLVGDNDIDLMIPKIFEAQKEVEFLHARNAEAGCFICKIERL